jgi:pyruvate/2-oxoacid:ferredoxin oxidoreductase alpha subunit/pyruvate/2-oxoacid:ferredoxin oxidoreductase beta subunit/Pyruvate/2-oxoacid:ferredoxin oxidoreductase delta subunit
MTLIQSSWIAEYTQDFLRKLAAKDASLVPWVIEEDPTAAVCLLAIHDRRYRVVSFGSLGAGFSLGLLGAQYERMNLDRSWPAPLQVELDRHQSRGRFYVLSYRSVERSANPLPLFTFLEDPNGNTHVLEVCRADDEAFWAVFTVAVHLLAERAEDPSRFDDFGDFQILGAPSIVQRHSTERLQKHLAQKVVFDQRLCTQCLRCVTACSEMRALVTEQGVRLLGPGEDFCTNCGLCQKRCSFLQARPKEELAGAMEARQRINEGGGGIHLYGSLAEDYAAVLNRVSNAQLSWMPYQAQTLLDVPPDLSRVLPISRQVLVSVSSAQEPTAPQPLLMTSTRAYGEHPASSVIRSWTRAALVLQTATGKVEQDMACAALRLGVQVTAVADWTQSHVSDVTGDSSHDTGNSNQTAQLFFQLGRYRQDALLDLWNRGEVDLFLAPYAAQVPAELQQLILEQTGKQAQILSPHILQAMPFTRNPLLTELNAEFLQIFMTHPELLEAEARYARQLLQDIPRNHALLHARYRSMAIASGHTACPTCAEAQVLAIPVYMAMAMSLGRGEIPQVSFTLETGCMSETLNKVNEVAQKIPGGRTVFGGGFAFGEAIAMAQDRAVRLGHLPKGRRYVVSQGGDGGSVIGLPAWLNALRQQAFLIRQRHPNVLHFINITDTQVYSNTGGESSASSLLGMGTLTTPIGKFLLGNQNVQWTLINLAAEFPGILVGVGHSANKTAMQEFWQVADQLGQSAIRWDVTPCPETGKFFGEDPDDLAEVMAHAGMLPEVVFVGRLRKRIAPYHPEDRHKPQQEWRRTPKPVLYWLQRDPRYRALLQKDPQTGKTEARNLVAHFLITQLQSLRDQSNWQIDLETRIVLQAEEVVRAFLQELQETWKHYRFRLEKFPFAMLFNRQGDWKPEYRVSLEWELVRRMLGWDELNRYAAVRDRGWESHQQQLEKYLSELGRLESILDPLTGPVEGSDEGLQDSLARVRRLHEELQQELHQLGKALPAGLPDDPVGEELFAQGTDGAPSLSETRRRHLVQLLEQIIEERGLAKQTELQQYRLAQQLKKDFLEGGGLIRSQHSVADAAERERLRSQVAAFGPFSVGVASLAGDRGIAINRIFAQFFTAKGAWAGMAWQFGSSKRGTPVLSATFVDARPLQRKDAMYSFPMAVLTVTNFEEMKRQPDLFFNQLHPNGWLIINQRKPAETLFQELLRGYPEEIRDLVLRLRQARGERRDAGAGRWDAQLSDPVDSGRRPLAGAGQAGEEEALIEEIAQRMWAKPAARLNSEQQRQARKMAAMVSARIVNVDMDGIMQQVAGTPNVVSNLVAVGPIFQALEAMGFPFDWERDLPLLTQGFPAAVIKNRKQLNQYYQAMEQARAAVQAANPEPGTTQPRVQPAAAVVTLPPQRAGEVNDPGEYLMIMGGTLAGMVLSQVATAEHPLFYVGFPITPAGNPFYAMAEAFANGHPYIVVDEVNPSEKVAAEKLIGIARAGGFLPVTFTASQGWRLFTEIIPQFVGARLEGLFLIAKRALAAPNLNIEESHTDFMSFRDDGGIMLAPKGIQEYVPALYLSRLLTHFAKIPVILSIGGITDTHKIGLVKVPSDDRVRDWLNRTLDGFDFLEHKLVNRQGELVVHGPSGTSAVYQETQSEIEKAHRAVTRIAPYALRAVLELTGVWLGDLEVRIQGGQTSTPMPPAAGETEPVLIDAVAPGACDLETLFILQGSLYPNAVEALQELEELGWSEMGCLSIRCFNPFPEEQLLPWLERAQRIVVLDRSNSFGALPPVAARVLTTLARLPAVTGEARPKPVRTLVGGLGGREITVQEMKEILLSTHLLFRASANWETPLIMQWLQEDALLRTLVQELAALDLRNTNRHTRVPQHLRPRAAQDNEFADQLERLRQLLLSRDYVAFLANYHQVEFVAPREVLQETALTQQIVLYLECRLARHAFETGQGTARRALVLLHYSQDPGDHETARRFLDEEASRGRLSPRFAGGVARGIETIKQVPEGEGGAGEDAVEALPSLSAAGVDQAQSADQPPVKSPEPPTGALPGSASQPSAVVFDAQEAQRIEAVLTELVTLQGEQPLFYNPEDFEHELLQRQQRDPQSPLFEIRRRLAASEADRVIWNYQCCYRDVVDRTLQWEILTQHHAPEMRELFAGEGWLRLQKLARRYAGELADESAVRRSQCIVQELEHYLKQRCLPHYPKTPLFYLEYFRNWVAGRMMEG